MSRHRIGCGGIGSDDDYGVGSDPTYINKCSFICFEMNHFAKKNSKFSVYVACHSTQHAHTHAPVHLTSSTKYMHKKNQKNAA